MKIAIVLLMVLPVALSLTAEERGILDALTGGVDILALAKQVAAQLGTEESEQACEQQLCHPLIDNLIPGHIIENIICGTVCQEAKIIAQQIPHKK